MLNFAKTLLDYKDQERTNHIFLIVSLLISIAYISIRFVDNIYFAKPNLGDEWFFYRDFSYYLMNGYYDSVLNGTSIPLMLIAKIIFFFTSNISISLRLANSIMVLLIFIYLLNRENLIVKKDKLSFLFFICLMIGTAGGTFYGTNDSFYSLGLLIILCECYLFYKHNTYNHVLLILSFTLCILSRPHWIINIPLIIICCMIFNFIQNKCSFKLMYKPIALSFIVSLVISFLFNYPKIIESNFSHSQGEYLPKYLFLSYSDKSNTYKTNDSSFNWIQWHFFSQNIASSKLFGLFSPMVEWDEVKEYKDFHGENSLPRSYLQYVKGYPFEVIKRVPVALIETFLMSIRYMGFFLFLLPMWLFLKYRGGDIKLNSFFVPTIVILTILSYAILLPRMLDNRWFLPIYILTMIFVYDQNQYLKSVLKDNIVILNMFLMNIITVWALWKWKIFLNI